MAAIDRPRRTAHPEPRYPCIALKTPMSHTLNLTLALPLALALALTLLAPAGPAQAHGDAAHQPAKPTVVRKEQKPWGMAADAAAVRRTITIEASDAMRYNPSTLTVRQGEKVRLAITNRGKALHELVLGTQAELEEHAALMRRFPEMEHDEAWMAHVPPGQTAHIDWHFNRSGTFPFGCLLPGHFEAGMVGTVVVEPAGRRR